MQTRMRELPLIEWQPTTLNFRPTHWAKDSALPESPHTTKRKDRVLGGSQNSLTFLGFGSIAILDLQVIFQKRDVASFAEALFRHGCTHNWAAMPTFAVPLTCLPCGQQAGFRLPIARDAPRNSAGQALRLATRIPTLA